LSGLEVRNAKPPAGRDAGLIADGSNLYLQVSYGRADGTNERPIRRSWVFRYELDGKRREMGLGSIELRSLKEAREKALEYRRLLLDGIDPLAHLRRGREAAAVAASKDRTFGEVAREYLDIHKHDWKNAKHAAQWQASLTEHAAAIAKVPVAAVNTTHMLDILQPIWRVTPETASRTRGRIERVIAYAIAAGYRMAEAGNPARADGHLQELLGSKAKAQRAKRERTGKGEHHRALPYADAPALVAALAALGSLSARATLFTILTAARTNETIGATWAEIDLDAKVWTIPGSRMKAGKEHRVPLSDRAAELLRGLPGEHTGRIFPLSNMAMLECVQGLNPNITVHGFRSTFMDWAHEQTAFAKVVIDMALAHTVGDKVEAAYRRGELIEKRKQLMQAWARYCGAPAASGTVTPLRRRADA
jgi:integrase